MHFKGRSLFDLCGKKSDNKREHRRTHRTEQEHVHEVQGSVFIDERVVPHNHRFATVSGEAIREGGRHICEPDYHVHDVMFRTDDYEEHYHEYSGRTGGPIEIGARHVHFLESVTSVNAGHRHEFRFATLIENPIGNTETPHKHS